MDYNHPTTQFLILFVLPLLVMALLIVLILCLSGDAFILNGCSEQIVDNCSYI